MDDVATLEKAIADALCPEGALVTNYVIVAEYLLPDDTRELVTDQADHMTDWQRDGLLYHGLYSYDWDDAEDED